MATVDNKGINHIKELKFVKNIILKDLLEK